ncbi:MAG: hypothetical protein GY927_08065 [bacterium]|nr:hypothetical protein [bacterium]
MSADVSLIRLADPINRKRGVAMDILDLISKARQGQSIPLFGAQFKLSQDRVEVVLAYVVPMLEDALTRRMASPQGLAAILAQLASGQYQRDQNANDLFECSRILANGTGILSLLLRNEAIIRTVAFVASEGAHIDVALVRRMMPYIAIFYMGALAKRSNEPLRQLANRCPDIGPFNDHASYQSGTYKLAELVRTKSPPPKPRPEKKQAMSSIKDILNTLARVEIEEKISSLNPSRAGYGQTAMEYRAF